MAYDGDHDSGYGGSPHQLPRDLCPSPKQRKDANFDLILQTHDGAKIPAHKYIFTLASSKGEGVLREMHIRGWDNHSTGSARLVLEVDADSNTVNTLLRYLYPLPEKPKLLNISEAFAVRGLACKYQMLYVVNIAEKAIVRLADEDPVAAYVEALRCRWSEGVRVAAKASLGPDIQTKYFPELKSTPYHEWYQLKEYQQRCRDAVVKCARSEGWIASVAKKEGWQPSWNVCHCATCTCTPQQKPVWFNNYLSEIARLLYITPRGRTLANPEPIIEALCCIKNCEKCRNAAKRDLLKLKDILAKKIEEIIDEVCSSFGAHLLPADCTTQYRYHLVPLLPYHINGQSPSISLYTSRKLAICNVIIILFLVTTAHSRVGLNPAC